MRIAIKGNGMTALREALAKVEIGAIALPPAQAVALQLQQSSVSLVAVGMALPLIQPPVKTGALSRDELEERLAALGVRRLLGVTQTARSTRAKDAIDIAGTNVL